MTAKKLIYTISLILAMLFVSVFLTGCISPLDLLRTKANEETVSADAELEIPDESSIAPAVIMNPSAYRSGQAHVLEGTVINSVTGATYYCWKDGTASLTANHEACGLIWTHPWGESGFNIYDGITSGSTLVYSEHTCTGCGCHNTYYLSLIRTVETFNIKYVYLCESCHDALCRSHMKCCICGCYYDKNSAVMLKGAYYCGYCCSGSNGNNNSSNNAPTPASNPLSAYSSVLEHIKKLSSDTDPSLFTEGMLYDIDDNGTDELVLFFHSLEENTVNCACAIYTLRNGEPVCLDSFLLQPDVGGATANAQIVTANGETCLLLSWDNNSTDIDKANVFGESILFAFDGKKLERRDWVKYDLIYRTDPNTGSMQLIKEESTVYMRNNALKTIQYEDYKNWLSDMKVLAQMDGLPYSNDNNDKDQGLSLSEMESLFAS